MAMEPNQIGKLEIPVEFVVDKKALQGRFKQEVETEAKRIGQRQAEVQANEFVRGLEVQYQRRLGEAREELLRGLIDPKEFERRGREAAQAMNRAILNELERRGKGGTLGAAYNQDFITLTEGFKNVETTSRRGASGVGEMRESLASLLARASGVHPVLGRIANVFGTMALGSITMAAVLAGLAAVVTIFEKMRDAANEAREKTESAVERLKELKRLQDLGPGGQTKADVDLARAELERLRAQQREVKQDIERIRGGGVVDPELQGAMERAHEAELADLQKRADELAAAVRVGEQQVQEAEREAGRQRLGVYLQGTEADRRAAAEAAKEATKEREKAQQEAEKASERLASLQDDMHKRLAALTATASDDLLLAIDKLEADAREAAAKAGEAVSQEFLDGLAALRDDARATQALEGWKEQLANILGLDRGTIQQRALSGFAERMKKEAAAVREGSRAQKEYIGLAQRAEDARKKNADAIDKETEAEGKRKRAEELRDLRDRARLIEENARAAIQLANAIGMMDDEAAASLQNLAQLGGALYRLFSGPEMDLTALPLAIGAMAQLVKGLFGDSTSQQTVQDLLRQLQENARQIRENTQALKDFREAALSGMSGEERAAIENVGRTIMDWVQREGVSGTSVGAISYFTGLSVDEVTAFLEQLQELTGTKIFDAETGILNMEEFLRAWDEFMKKGLGGFDATVGGALDAMLFRWQMMGAGAISAADKLDDFLAVLRKFDKTGSFADALAAALAEGGAEGANALLDDLARRFAEGDQSLFAPGGMFAGLTAEEVRRLLEEGNDLIEQLLTGGKSGTTQDFVQARSITELTAGRIEGSLFSLEALAHERNELLRQILAAQGVNPALVLGPVAGVSASDIGAGVFGGSQSVSLAITGPLIGEATFSASNGSVISEAQQQAQVERVAEILSTRIVKDVNRGLGESYRSRRRTLGRA